MKFGKTLGDNIDSILDEKIDVGSLMGRDGTIKSSMGIGNLDVSKIGTDGLFNKDGTVNTSLDMTANYDPSGMFTADIKASGPGLLQGVTDAIASTDFMSNQMQAPALQAAQPKFMVPAVDPAMQQVNPYGSAASNMGLLEMIARAQQMGQM
jgi:hypothetical protein